MTLIELMAVLAIVGILTGMTTEKVAGVRYQAEVAKAIGDIQAIEVDIATYEADGGLLPSSLDEIGRGELLDPWGRPYVYYPFPPAHGSAPPAGSRRDRFLVPINTTYDLYSVGRDGGSSTPLTAQSSLDDVVRGDDGGFVGLGSKY